MSIDHLKVSKEDVIKDLDPTEFGSIRNILWERRKMARIRASNCDQETVEITTKAIEAINDQLREILGL